MNTFHKQQKRRALNRGFTLVELLVVIAIIGILATVVLIQLGLAREKARDVKRVTDLRQIKTALELYYDDNGGTYPPSSCGWDCNGYLYSWNSAGWDTLAIALAPYIVKLPVDSLNTPGCGPWVVGCYAYSYGNVGRTTYAPQYDLNAQLESAGNPLRCTIKQYRFYFNNINPWCGPYSGQIYEVSN